MKVALHCYSVLCQGKGQKGQDLHASMFELFHGKPASKPSQLKLLCSASHYFKHLFPESSDFTMEKSALSSVQSLKIFTLKLNPCCSKSQTYTTGIDIMSDDFEIKSTGSPLMTSCQLFDLAKQGSG